MPPPIGYVPLADSELVHASGARAAGARLNLNEVADVLLFVRAPSGGAALHDHIESQGRARMRDRQYLSRSEFTDSYGADVSDLDAVVTFAHQAGLTIAAINPAARTVRLSGTLSTLAQAFNIQFALYQSPHGTYRGYTGSVNVPHALSGIVKGVFGLDNKPQSRYHLRKLVANPAGRAAPAAATAQYAPNQVAELYNFPTDVDGTGQCVGIIEFGGGYRTGDLDTYFQTLGITTPQVAAVGVSGAVNAPTTANSADDEVMLDIEVVGCVASGALIVVYFAPNTTLGWLRAIQTAVHDTYNNPGVISISWGGPENTWSRAAMEALDYMFQAAGALGVTICAAAGDQGYTDGIPGGRAHVDFPASSPHVLACGGTRLDSSDGTIQSETVWNDQPSSATGGGVSAVFALPSYQDEANVPKSVNPPHSPGRGVPDVAGDADPNTGYIIRVDGKVEVIGGTSAVAPLWAGLLTLVNQQTGSRLGFVNPLLYTQGVDGGGFHDIVSGNNGAGGYQATPGWDACTGLGTPDGTALAEAL